MDVNIEQELQIEEELNLMNTGNEEEDEQDLAVTLAGAHIEFGRAWFFSKQKAKDHYGPSAFYVKLTNKLFTGFQTRTAFLDFTTDLYKKKGFLPELYELVQGEWPRLYFDLEIEFEEEQKTSKSCTLIADVLQLVLDVLVNLGCSKTDTRLHSTVEMVPKGSSF